MTFDPEGHFTKDSSIFGLPKNMPSKLALLPCPWEPTTSFKKGCKNGPKALFEASKQMDLYHPYFKNIYKKGIHWSIEQTENIMSLNETASKLCDDVQNHLDEDKTPPLSDIEKINEISKTFNHLVYENTIKALRDKKGVGLVGGDHSCPFGLIKALSEFHSEPFSILHIDAHFDFRRAYQGFEHSHASIMYNILEKIKNPPKIYQIGLRDFCESEWLYAQERSTFITDQELQRQVLLGRSFQDVLDKFFKGLDENIYLSFDIDGLSPEFCPNTGTPVPGGLSYSQAQYIIEELHRKGHKLIGFDLVEVSPNTNRSALGEGIDEITAIRILYSLSCFALASL